MSGASQLIVCGWAFVVAACALNGDTLTAATVAFIIGIVCFAASIVLNITGR